MKADSHTSKDIAKYLGVSRATLYRYLGERIGFQVNRTNQAGNLLVFDVADQVSMVVVDLKNNPRDNLLKCEPALIYRVAPHVLYRCCTINVGSDLFRGHRQVCPTQCNSNRPGAI
jgi:hypothetical protein